VLGAPRSGEKDESEVRWLISYSDFMMQLVCLFILLYSVSFFDKGPDGAAAGGYRASIGMGDLAALETRTRGDQLAVGDRPLFGRRTRGAATCLRAFRFRIDPIPGGRRVAVDVAVFEPGSSSLTPAGGNALDAAPASLRAYAGRSIVTAFGEDAPRRPAPPGARARAGRRGAPDARPASIPASSRPPASPAAGRTRTLTIELRTD
jgi:hypothetical protein